MGIRSRGQATSFAVRESLTMSTCPEGNRRLATHLALIPKAAGVKGTMGACLKVGGEERSVNRGERGDGEAGRKRRGRRRGGGAEPAAPPAARWLAGPRVRPPPPPPARPSPRRLASRKCSKKSKSSARQDGNRLLQLPAQGHLLGHRWTHSEGSPLPSLPRRAASALPAPLAVPARRQLLPGDRAGSRWRVGAGQGAPAGRNPRSSARASAEAAAASDNLGGGGGAPQGRCPHARPGRKGRPQGYFFLSLGELSL